ncbi:MAG: PEP-CTERM sorting domain-containing protein [Myxococcota bacterium]
MRSALALGSLVLVFFSAAPTLGAQIVDLDRRVVSSSLVDAYQSLSKDDAVGFRSSAPGTFLQAAVGGTGVGDLTNVNAESVQETEVRFGPGEGFLIRGSGSAGVGFDVNDPGYPSRAQGSADSSLTITFEVTSPIAFTLGIALSAELPQLEVLSGEGPVDGLVAAFARLYGPTGFLLDFSIEDDDVDGLPVEETRTLSGILVPGIYGFEVGTSTSLRGFENSVGLGQAGFGLDFLAVPEPTSALLLGLGLAFLSRSTRSNRTHASHGSKRSRRSRQP